MRSIAVDPHDHIPKGFCGSKSPWGVNSWPAVNLYVLDYENPATCGIRPSDALYLALVVVVGYVPFFGRFRGRIGMGRKRSTK